MTFRQHRAVAVFQRIVSRPTGRSAPHLFPACALLLVAAMTAGCGKKGESGATAEQGCGSDWADAQKQFCLKMPAGYTPAPQSAGGGELYSEIIDFNGPSSGFTITVGFTSSNFTTYEEQLAADEDIMKMAGRSVESTGGTPGQSKWWIFTDKASGSAKNIVVTAKANGNKSLRCSPNNTVVAPEVMDACKSIRAYPGGSASASTANANATPPPGQPANATPPPANPTPAATTHSPAAATPAKAAAKPALVPPKKAH